MPLRTTGEDSDERSFAANDETDASETEESVSGAEVQSGTNGKKEHTPAALTDAAHAGTLPLQASTRAVPSLDACSVYGTRPEEAAAPHANRGRLLHRAPRPMQGFLWPSWFGKSPFLTHTKNRVSLKLVSNQSGHLLIRKLCPCPHMTHVRSRRPRNRGRLLLSSICNNSTLCTP